MYKSWLVLGRIYLQYASDISKLETETERERKRMREKSKKEKRAYCVPRLHTSSSSVLRWSIAEPDSSILDETYISLQCGSCQSELEHASTANRQGMLTLLSPVFFTILLLTQCPSVRLNVKCHVFDWRMTEQRLCSIIDGKKLSFVGFYLQAYHGDFHVECCVV